MEQREHWEIWSHFWHTVRWMDICYWQKFLYVANLSWIVLKADLVLDHGICNMSYFTSARNINLLLQNFGLPFALSRALYSASFPEHHCLYFHCINSTLSSLLFAWQGYNPTRFAERLRDLFKSLRNLCLAAGWTQPPSPCGFIPPAPSLRKALK